MSEYKAVETKPEGAEFWVRAAKGTRAQWEKEAANKTGEIDCTALFIPSFAYTRFRAGVVLT